MSIFDGLIARGIGANTSSGTQSVIGTHMVVRKSHDSTVLPTSITSPIELEYYQKILRNSTLTDDMITICKVSDLITIPSKNVIHSDGITLRLFLSNPLDKNTVYRVTVQSNALKDRLGNVLSGIFTYDFTTKASSPMRTYLITTSATEADINTSILEAGANGGGTFIFAEGVHWTDVGYKIGYSNIHLIAESKRTILKNTMLTKAHMISIYHSNNSYNTGYGVDAKVQAVSGDLKTVTLSSKETFETNFLKGKSIIFWDKDMAVVPGGVGAYRRDIIGWNNTTKQVILNTSLSQALPADARYSIVYPTLENITVKGFTIDSGSYEYGNVLQNAATNSATGIYFNGIYNDYLYTNNTVDIIGGTGIGQSRTITSWNKDSKLGVISVAWDTIPDTTSKYRILRHTTGTGGIVAYAVGKQFKKSLSVGNNGYDASNVGSGHKHRIGLIIEDNTFKNFYWLATYLFEVQNSIMRGNTIQDSSGGHVYFATNNTDTSFNCGNIITDNLIQNANASYLYISETSHSIIKSNILRNCLTGGSIAFAGLNTKMNIASSNLISGINTTSGINSSTGVSNITALGNMIINNKGGGGIWSAVPSSSTNRMAVIGNMCRGNNGAGIGSNYYSSSHHLYTGNWCGFNYSTSYMGYATKAILCAGNSLTGNLTSVTLQYQGYSYSPTTCGIGHIVANNMGRLNCYANYYQNNILVDTSDTLQVARMKILNNIQVPNTV